jgi:hypothetical protein
MKFMLLVCWDAEKMDGQTEPDPTDASAGGSFPWLDDVQAQGCLGHRRPAGSATPGPLDPGPRREDDRH